MSIADPAVIEVLEAFAAVMSRWGDRWYLFGAQAATVWGRPRMSADVDVTANIDSRHVEFIDEMRDAGFDLRITDWPEFLSPTRVLPFLYGPAGLPLDLVLAGPGLEEEFLNRAVRVKMSKRDIPISSPEDLRSDLLPELERALAATAGT